MELLSQAVELFLGEQIPSTRLSYEFVLEDMLKYLPAGITIKAVKAEALLAYMQMVRNRPGVKSKNTIGKYVKTLKVLFNWLKRLDVIDKAPTEALKMPRINRLVSKEKAMTNAEYERLLDVCEEQIELHPDAVDRYRDLALVLFVGDTGCRARGAASLMITKLDMVNMSAEVIEKGDKIRTVWFGERCAAALDVWFAKRNEWLFIMDAALEGPYVFHRRGIQFKNENIGRIIRHVCQKAGVRSMGSHSLRHRKGHQLAAQVPVTIAAIALGHENPSITLEYYYPKDTSQAEKAIRDLSARRGPTHPAPNQNPQDTVTDRNGIQEPKPEIKAEPAKDTSKIIDIRKYLAG